MTSPCQNVTHSAQRRFFANLHGSFFPLKNGRFKQFHRTGFVDKLRATGTLGPHGGSNINSYADSLAGKSKK